MIEFVRDESETEQEEGSDEEAEEEQCFED